MVCCPNCDADRCRIFHRIAAVPVNSCHLLPDRQSALAMPRGDIDLAFCPDCGFIFNAAWKPDRTVYSALYEETQGFSPTFKSFHHQLAEHLIARYDLVGKEVVEIGCGKGEFLALLCELGGNRGIGYDPSFIPARMQDRATNIVFKREVFSEVTIQPAPDLVCCKMTLEHIFHTRRFVQSVRRIATPARRTVVFFQVPDVRRILSEAAFWDVYYEHCSYFSPQSLRHLFQAADFEVIGTSTGFDGQYLMIEARPIAPGVTPPLAPDGELEELARGIACYAGSAMRGARQWRSKIRTIARSGGRTVLWGSGSKAVAFLSALGVDKEIEYLVDINPYRHGKFVPGSGKQIVAPQFLTAYRPDLVIAMNPIYRTEIAHDLVRLGCGNAELCTVGAPPAVEPVAAPMPRTPAPIA